MLEAKLSESGMIKRLLDSIKELVTDANFSCNEEGINLQAMDNSHVALVKVMLQATGFKRYRCDRPMPLGVNLNTLTKVFKCAKDEDECTLKAADEADTLNLVYEAKSSDRIAEYDVKLMDIDSDSLDIPDTEYDARVILRSAEFSRIVKDLSLLGESVRIEVSKEGVRFTSSGETADGSILLRQTEGGSSSGKIKPKFRHADSDAEDDEDREEVKKEKDTKKKVKKEGNGDDVDMDDNNNDKEARSDDEGEEEQDQDDDDDDDDGGKKRKMKSSQKKSSKKAKTSSKSKGKKKADSDDEDLGEDFEGVRIEMNAHACLTFSLKYLVNFSKSAGLSTKVELYLSNEVPLLVSYDFGQGHIRYYLAPKIGDD